MKIMFFALRFEVWSKVLSSASVFVSGLQLSPPPSQSLILPFSLQLLLPRQQDSSRSFRPQPTRVWDLDCTPSLVLALFFHARLTVQDDHRGKLDSSTQCLPSSVKPDGNQLSFLQPLSQKRIHVTNAIMSTVNCLRQRREENLDPTTPE